ncbi:endo-1,4-beta-xylanase [Candidatus Bathyarchaeota archaeon]|nr:endo-1,4-beta-xylanase [Candidatus Bathyarchaeota archaeon]
MKRTFAFLSLALLILSACAPVAAPTSAPATSVRLLSTATPAPSATATPTLTPTPTATPTATPLPTLPPESVGGLEGVPDPHFTNPELFDLKNRNAPIPKLVYAMKKAGINVTNEEVLQKIYVSTKNDGTPLVDKDGNPTIVVAYHLDPDPNQKGETLEGPIPLMIAKKNEEGKWRWQENTTRSLSESMDFPFGGTIDSRKNQQEKYPVLFTAANLSYDLEWNNIEPIQGRVIFSNSSNYAFADEKFDFAKKNGLGTIMIRLFYPPTYPKWLINGNFTKEQLVELAIKHIHDILYRFGREIKYVDLATEYFPQSWNIRPDVLKDRVGYERFITTVALEVQKTAPNVTIIINADHNERIGSPDYQNTVQLIKLLKDAGIKNLAVGMEMHINGASPPTKEQIIQAIHSYGVPVIVTEMDVNIKDLKGPDRLKKQAQIYKNILDACLESENCRAFFVFQIGDQYSWLENGGYMGSPDSDATILDDNLNPKLSYYAILQALYQRLLQINS